MDLLGVIIGLLFYSPALSSFIAGFLAEELLLVLSFLAGHGALSFWTVAGWGLLGVFCIDSLYYVFGRWKRFHAAVGRRISHSTYKGFVHRAAGFSKRSPFIALFLSKFIYGPRMVLVMYFSYRGMPYKRFVLYELSALLLWGIIMLPLAALFGIWIISALHFIKRIEKLLIVGVILILLYGILSRAVTKRFIANREKKN